MYGKASTKTIDSKGNTLVIVIVVVLLLGGFGAWYVYQGNPPTDPAPTPTPTETPTPTPDPYEGWETYVNDEYGYSVKYPPGWFSEDAGGASAYSNIVTFRDEEERTHFTKVMSVAIVDKPDDGRFVSKYWNGDSFSMFTALREMDKDVRQSFPATIFSAAVEVEIIEVSEIQGRVAVIFESYSTLELLESIDVYIWDDERIIIMGTNGISDEMLALLRRSVNSLVIHS
jgi:hypothetical protein